MSALNASGFTRVYGIFGHPVRHTLSPQMHQAAFESLGMQAAYLPFEVHPNQLQQAVDSIPALGIQGVNVTLPHKEKVMAFLDDIDSEAEQIGAVNTIKNDSGRLIGYNTDGRGYVASLEEMFVTPAEKTVILLGAGGAAKGVAVALIKAGVKEIFIRSRRKEAGTALSTHLKSATGFTNISVMPFDQQETDSFSTQNPVLLINTTPLGMKAGDPIPFPPHLIQASWTVSDLIYRPSETPLLKTAKKAGAKTVPGLGMLLHQGVLSFQLWTSLHPPIEHMKQALLKAISNT